MTTTHPTIRFRHMTCRASAVLLTLCLAPKVLAGETITYFYNDIAGSPVLATDVNGLEVWKETYRPYGDQLIDSPAARNNSIWFTGKPFDDNTGLSYMGARYYDPTLGRFMGIDPAPFSLDNLHSFNRYAYANNNPFKFVDPDGREATGAAWLQRTDAFFNAMPDPRNRLEASLALAGVALPFAAVGGVFTAEVISAALANPAVALSITEGVLAGEALGGGTLAAAGGAVAAAKGTTTALSEIRYTQAGEKFIRYESANSAFSRVTSSGGVKPGTYAAPASEGIVPVGQRASTYNLPDPHVPRTNYVTIQPPAGTPIVGPRPVAGGTGNEVYFLFGF